MSLAKRIREARKRADLTLEELSIAAGVSKTYLWELEQDDEGGKRPSADVLLKIANALKSSIAELLDLPTVQVDQTRVDISPSLVEFQKWMKQKLGQPLDEQELRDLATMRFRGGQPTTKEAWYDLYLTLKRTTGR